MSLYIWKSLHLFGAFAWMAAMWYLPRILIYQREIFDTHGHDADKLMILHKMSRRLLKFILMPSMGFTLIVGFILAIQAGSFSEGWFHGKLLCIVIFCIYSIYLAKVTRKMREGTYSLSDKQLRWLNEVPTINLIATLGFAVVYAYV